jgi:phage-related minor tail protein
MAKAVKESDVVLNFKMDGQVQYAQTVKEINKVMNTAASEYKMHISAMDEDATTTQKLAAQKQKLQIQLEGAEKRTKLLREQYEASVEETGAYSEESKKLYKALIDSETGQNKLEKALESTNDELRKQAVFSDEAKEKLEKLKDTSEKIKDVGESMTGKVTAPILAIGAAGFAVANEITTSQAEIQASLGLTKKEAESLQNVATAIWEDGWRDSIDGVQEAIKSVITQMPKLKEQGPDAIQSITEKAIILEDKLDSDMGETLRGANALMTTFGMSGEEAMDYITAATQAGLNKTDELGDNLAEYATLFEENGYSASEMFEILNAGLDGGAYNLDKVNDLVKEFGIRVSDGTIKDAIGEIGGSWQELYNSWEQSGGSQKDLFQDIAKEISKVKDEQQKATLVSEIFGSLGEDAGYKVIEAMGQASLETDGVKSSFDDVNGSADELKKTLEDSVTWQSALNTMKSALSEIGEVVAPYVYQFAENAKQFAEWFKGLDDGAKNMIVVVGLLLAAIGPLLIIIGQVGMGITAVITTVKNLQLAFSALKLLLAANPFALVIAGIVLLIGALVLAYNKVKWFRDGVNAFFNGIKDVGVMAFNFLAGFIGTSLDGGLQNVKNFVSAVRQFLGGLVDFVAGVFTGNWSRAWNGVKNIFGGIFSGIAAMAKAPINAMIGLINGFLGGLNRIKIPKWVPKVGGRGFNIAQIPYLAKGGHLINGQAIVGEAGPELLTAKDGKTTVTPLSDPEKKNPPSPREVKVEQHVHIDKVDANNPSELNRMNRKLEQASRQAIYDLGGVPG